MRRHRLLRAIGGATLIVAALGVANYLNPLSPGVRATYFANPRWTPPAAFARRDSHVSTAAVSYAWTAMPPPAFSVVWSGAIVAPHDGEYTFATLSDDDSSVLIDGQLVVDNLGRHPAIRATGTVHLARGVHALRVQYAQQGGDFEMALEWSRDGSPLASVPSWALWPQRTRHLALLLPGLLIRWAFEAALWVWIALLVFGSVYGACLGARRLLQRNGLWPAVGWIAGGSLLLNAIGFWWGLPGTWVATEILPAQVLTGLSRRFAAGWFEAYPPVQYYLFALVGSPVMRLHSYGISSVHAPHSLAVLLALYRLVSLAAAAGTVIAAAMCGTLAFGKRAGVFAAAIVALVAPFVYYAKTANTDVPYLFWFAMSLVFYLRLLNSGRMADFVLFGASAALAICTKDQAYALYLLTPIPVVHALWRSNCDAAIRHPLRRALLDRRLVAAALAAVVVFAAAHNLLWNADGFLKHVRLIMHAAPAYRMFDPTPSGRLALGGLTLHIVIVSMGWPFFAAAAAGAITGFGRTASRRSTRALLIIVPSYYFGLLNVILYNYDRFMLPVCFVLALFGGLAMDGFLRRDSPPSAWRVALVGGAFAYSLLYASTVDVLMLNDSRYTVERWLTARVGRADTVGFIGMPEYLPRLDRMRSVEIPTIDALHREQPRYFVLNADYTWAVPRDSEWGRLAVALATGRVGYRLASRFRQPAPWFWLPAPHPDLVGARREAPIYSVLRNINPTIEVFERELGTDDMSTPAAGRLAQP